MSIISAGTSNTTTLVYTGDTTGNLVFQSNGTTEAMRITNTQRVGIGNTNPSTPLQVNGTITATSVNTNNTFGFKNRIINGAMVIDQRNAGASVTPADGAYTLDRWQAYQAAASKFSVQQNAGSVTPPTGFTNYLGVTSLAATSVSSSDYYIIAQKIEGFNTADLDFGKSTAKTITISFWVRSSLTGTFGASILNSAQNRSYPFTYTISSANTWEQKTITIAGDTTGTWVGATNGIGINVFFSLGMGSTYSGTANAWAGSTFYSATGATSVVGTNGATFYITGVQLEVGSTATSFDYRPYGTELALCQRYCINYKASDAGNYMRFGSGYANSGTNLEINVHFPVTMRTSPSLTVTSTASNYGNYIGGVVAACSSVPVIDVTNSDNPSVSTVNATSSGSFSSSGGGSIISNNNTTAYMLFTAEL